MKLQELLKEIRKEVKAAVKEALQESVQSSGNRENITENTPNYLASLREQMKSDFRSTNPGNNNRNASVQLQPGEVDISQLPFLRNAKAILDATSK